MYSMVSESTKFDSFFSRHSPCFWLEFVYDIHPSMSVEFSQYCDASPHIKSISICILTQDLSGSWPKLPLDHEQRSLWMLTKDLSASRLKLRLDPNSSSLWITTYVLSGLGLKLLDSAHHWSQSQLLITALTPAHYWSQIQLWSPAEFSFLLRLTSARLKHNVDSLSSILSHGLDLLHQKFCLFRTQHHSLIFCSTKINSTCISAVKSSWRQEKWWFHIWGPFFPICGITDIQWGQRIFQCLWHDLQWEVWAQTSSLCLSRLSILQDTIAHAFSDSFKYQCPTLGVSKGGKPTHYNNSIWFTGPFDKEST